MIPEPAGDPNFGSWDADQSPITIEYSLVVIEEIRQEVAQGLQRFSRGGLEVGGVLYGTREGRSVRVQAMRPIACEHKQGPSFQLSEDDRAALEQQVRESTQDTQLEGLACVGWFVSHTRSEEIAMTESDMDIFSAFFRNPWQVTLVVKPGRGGAMRAGFFVWENDGTVQAEQSYKEFNFPDRLAGVLDRIRERSGEPRLGHRSGQPIPVPSRHDPMRLETGSGMRTAPTPIFEQSQYMPAPAPERKWWPWVVAAVAVLLIAGGVFGYRYYMDQPPPQPIALAVADQDGQLQIQWNSLARAIGTSVSASLAIVDGGTPVVLPLNERSLSDGRYVYPRKSGDVEVRLLLKDKDGVETQEIARFVGRAPEPVVSEETQKAADQLSTVQAENARLKQENAALRQQVQQLQRTQKILETRITTQGIK